jgi:hypothetical protein
MKLWRCMDAFGDGTGIPMLAASLNLGRLDRWGYGADPVREQV